MFGLRRDVSWLLSGLVMLLLVPVASSAADEPARRPNVIVIMIDDLGRQDLGCYGSQYYRTPHIDQLAKQGVQFSNAYAACPVCSPTRAALMTGKYPARLHLTDWLPGRGNKPAQKLACPPIQNQLPLEEVTLAEAFRKAGYATGHIGKWHLGGEGFGPLEQGFDSNVAGDHTGTPLSYMAPFRKGERFMPGLEDAPEGEYLTDRLALEAEKFLEKHRDQPFFLNLSHYAVHTPLTAKAEQIAKYDQTRKPGQQSNAIYAAMIESVDDSVGRIVRKLQELKLNENTIVVFTSDNGGLCVGEGPNTPATINAPLREGKGYLYEGGIRAPLLISWPAKFKAQRNVDAITSTIDLLPTLLELAGVKHEAAIDGISLANVLLNQGELKRDAIYWHYPHYANQGGRPGGAIRRGDYKLIEFYDSGRRELFHIAKDLSESRNLALEKPELVEQLAADLAAWRESVGAQMMTPNPEYMPCPQGPGGGVTMPARLAEVRGQQLRFEPLPHKNTLGYWTQIKDTAHWEFTIDRPGKFRLEILQGCGKGSGGSEVEFVVTAPDAKTEQRVTTIVQDTGGFQEFVRRDIGELTLSEAGRYQLVVRPLSKPGVAVMDLREVRLAPAK